MLVFFCVLIIIFIIVLIVYYSSIRIEIKNVKIDTTQKPIINDYRINIYLAFLNKIKYLKLSIYKEKIDKIKNLKFNKIKEKITKLNMFNNLKENGLVKNTNLLSKSIKNTHIRLEKFHLKADVGMENIIILSYLVAVSDIIISLFLGRRTISNSNYKEVVSNYKYVIVPKQSKNMFIKSNINAEISLKISNIVKTSCNLKKIKV